MLIPAIVERELRVLSRQRFAPWLRVGVAMLTSLLAATILLEARTPSIGLQTGRTLLTYLSWMAVAFCLIEGARQSAGSLSQEKREGTLGLLFLTDLTGFDVVAGKFVAATLMSFYGLLAAFPVMGIALTAGGVTAGEFWRVQIVLLNTLFLTTAAGFWISARSRDESRALLDAAQLILWLAVVMPWIELYSAPAWLPTISPITALALAQDAAYSTEGARFWSSMLAMPALGWVALAATARKLSTRWRDAPPPKGVKSDPAASFFWNYQISPRLHAKPPRSLLEPNPAAWLAARAAGLAPLLWIAVLLPEVQVFFWNLVGSQWFTAGAANTLFGAQGVLTWTSRLLSNGLVVWVAARGLNEARRTGELELLLCSPLTTSALVRGQWLALWRNLRLPLLLVVIGEAGIWTLGRILSGASPADWGKGWPVVLCVNLLVCVQRVLMPLTAAWLGLWLGLACSKIGQAICWVFFLISLIPWWATRLFYTGLNYFGLNSFRSSNPSWLDVLYFLRHLLIIAWLVWLLVWARRRLLRDFRRMAAAPPLGWRDWRFWRHGRPIAEHARGVIPTATCDTPGGVER